jgi:hypothetical protein
MNLKALKVHTEVVPLNSLNVNVTNQRLYFKNLNFLSNKRIKWITTYDDNQYTPNNIIYLSNFLSYVTINLVDHSNYLRIENLSCARLGYIPALGLTTQKIVGLPITGQFNFDKSYLSILININPFIYTQFVPISFYYE